MDQSSEDVAFTAFRRAHWPKVCSTNPLERANKEIERRDQGRGIFPNEAAVIRMAGAGLADIHDECQVSDRAPSPKPDRSVDHHLRSHFRTVNVRFC